MELVAACCGVVLVLGDHPCSLAVCVVLYLALPGKATCLEAPASRGAGVGLRSVEVWLYRPRWATRTDDRPKGRGGGCTASVYDTAGQIQVCHLLSEETDVTGWRILPGCLLLREPLEFSRNQTLVVPPV